MRQVRADLRWFADTSVPPLLQASSGKLIDRSHLCSLTFNYVIKINMLHIRP